jgi:uncharacterized protein YjbI with pentapeptide repeats
MKASLLNKEYPLKGWKKNSENKSIARTITLTTLMQLNSEQDKQKVKEEKYNQRKGLIMQFLYESDLINTYTPIIPLNTADFTFANLESASLGSANLETASPKSAYLESAELNNKIVNLEGANLNSANLNSADLENANLNSANLNSANLNSASLISADLNNANLKSANLKSANLKSASLISANLAFADLAFANLNSADNLTNKQIKSACSWEKAIYTEAEFDETNGWSAEDPKDNQRRIDEIKQDKASDPPKPPDCSRWQ